MHLHCKCILLIQHNNDVVVKESQYTVSLQSWWQITDVINYMIARVLMPTNPTLSNLLIPWLLTDFLPADCKY